MSCKHENKYLQKFNTFEYVYCPDCKQEVEEPQIEGFRYAGYKQEVKEPQIGDARLDPETNEMEVFDMNRQWSKIQYL